MSHRKTRRAMFPWLCIAIGGLLLHSAGFISGMPISMFGVVMAAVALIGSFFSINSGTWPAFLLNKGAYLSIVVLVIMRGLSIMQVDLNLQPYLFVVEFLIVACVIVVALAAFLSAAQPDTPDTVKTPAPDIYDKDMYSL